jgi:hypothetical protein
MLSNKKILFFSYFNGDKKSFQVGKYGGKEDVYVDNVKLCGGLENNMNRKACITFRVPVSVIFIKCFG